MRLPAFEYHQPTTIAEAVELMVTLGPNAKLMAGGTDLLPSLKSGKRSCDHVVALGGIAELAMISFVNAKGLKIGAHVPLSDVADFPATRANYGILADSIDVLATPQVRNKATVAGNICNASPCADTATPLMVFGATANIVGPDGGRDESLEAFITGPNRTSLKKGELLKSISLPPPSANLRTSFLKFSPRSKVDIAAVNLSLGVEFEGEVLKTVNLFLGTVAPTPMRAVETEKVLLESKLTSEVIAEAVAAARGECRPITDFRATAGYKRHMVGVLVERALKHVAVTT